MDWVRTTRFSFNNLLQVCTFRRDNVNCVLFTRLPRSNNEDEDEWLWHGRGNESVPVAAATNEGFSRFIAVVALLWQFKRALPRIILDTKWMVVIDGRKWRRFKNILLLNCVLFDMQQMTFDNFSFPLLPPLIRNYMAYLQVQEERDRWNGSRRLGCRKASHPQVGDRNREGSSPSRRPAPQQRR